MRPDGQPTGLEAYHINQRDEGIDLHDLAGTLGAQPGMKQQTFVAGFSAGAGSSAGGIGYNESVAPTLKGSPGGNCMPSVLCLNDQGGSVMNCSENISGTLRAQEHGHQPLVFDNHGQDSCQDDLAYTLTATDRHAVYSRQRVDDFRHNDVASTQSARQYKDATDLICQQAEACAHLIRRLTPLECERLQGFQDGWTGIPNASDSARYKALGNSVAIPCVEFIMSRIAAALL